DLAGGIGLSGPVFRGAACSHFALRQVEDTGPLPELGHLEQSAAASLLHVVTVSCNRQNVQGWLAQSISPDSTVTLSLMIRRCAAISLICGSTRLTCSSVSMKVSTSGNLPPASTRLDVLTRLRPVNPATACRTVAPATCCSCR